MKICTVTAKLLGVFNSLPAAQRVVVSSRWLWLDRRLWW